MKLEQLEKFINTRNAASLHSNQQFQIDAEACGFKASDLGKARRTGDGGWVWETPHGKLYERETQLTLVRKSKAKAKKRSAA